MPSVQLCRAHSRSTRSCSKKCRQSAGWSSSSSVHPRTLTSATHWSFLEAVRPQLASSGALDLIVCLEIESTTIALLARLAGLLEPLAQFLKTKPVWGTCAGAILLSSAVENAKKGGQEVLGGVSVKIARNGWGSQVRHIS